MLAISMFVSQLREVLRPGALAFLKDPADPNFNPFRDLVEEPLPRHARRIVASWPALLRSCQQRWHACRLARPQLIPCAGKRLHLRRGGGPLCLGARRSHLRRTAGAAAVAHALRRPAG